jgi:mevalonate kinase
MLITGFTDEEASMSKGKGLSVVASAPGKVILLGEHAVVFGQPAIAVAIDQRLLCSITPSDSFTLNGHPLNERTHAYVGVATSMFWKGGPLAIETTSEFPSGSGLGSSAAVSVAALGAIEAMQGQLEVKNVARNAFEIESLVQGRASPIDTSTSAHGKGIFVNNVKGDDFIWELAKDTRHWDIHHCEVPELNLVVGFTGISAATGPLVAKVKRFADKSRFAREVIEEIGQLTIEGREALRHNDPVKLGSLMTRDQKLLAILGVSCQALDDLIDASLPLSYGAKLTGAGGGGSMVALTDRPDQVAEVIRSKGGYPIKVRTGVPGVTIETPDVRK